VREHLASFGLNFDVHIVGSTTDGCSMMIKYGRITLAEHVVCQNHSNNLAVGDVVQKGPETHKKSKTSKGKSKNDNYHLQI
jgi:hypothetical protein